jgi:hypothetical protein
MSTVKLSNSVKLFTGVAAAAISLAATSAAVHASIVWGAAQDMTGVNDIATNGTFLDAVQTAQGTTSVTVTSTNGDQTIFAGSLYSAISPASSPAYTATTPNGYITVDADAPFSATNYGTFNPSSTNSNYNTVVSSGVFENANGSGTDPGEVILNNLVSGHTYQVEVWAYYQVSTQNSSTTFSGGTPVTLVPSQAQYAIGTFVASGNTQSFTFSQATPGLNNQSVPLVNDIALRDITATPEPASLAMFSAGAVGLLILRRSKHRSL